MSLIMASNLIVSRLFEEKRGDIVFSDYFCHIFHKMNLVIFCCYNKKILGILCICICSYSFMPIAMELYRFLVHDLKMCILLGHNP